MKNKDKRSEKMKSLSKEYKKHKSNKPIKKGKNDIFFDSNLEQWKIEKSKLHNKICDQAINDLNTN